MTLYWRYSNRLKGSQLEDAYPFHLNELENGQQRNHDDPPRSLLRKEAMEGHAPILLFKSRQYFLNFSLDAEVF